MRNAPRSGVTAAQFGNIENSPAAQYNFLQGGNPDLAPEESDTYSFGLVWTPGFLDGLVFSFDYYAIEISKGISTLTPEFILNECLDGQRLAVRQGPARAERRPVAGLRPRHQRSHRVPAGQPGH